MTYSVHRIIQEGLLLKPNGDPYKNRSAVIKLLKRYGYTRSAYSANGVNCYALTTEDIDRINVKEKKRIGKTNAREL